jgi:hypothetical protein
MKNQVIREVLEESAREVLELCEGLIRISQSRNDGARAFVPLICLCNFTPSPGDLRNLAHSGVDEALIGTWIAAVAEAVEKWKFSGFELSEGTQDPLGWTARQVDQVLQAVLGGIPEDEAAVEDEVAAAGVVSEGGGL